MSLMTRFEHGAIRKGFILEEVSWNLCVCAKGWFSLSVISLCPGFCTTMSGLVIGCKRISCRAVFFGGGPIMLSTLLQF